MPLSPHTRGPLGSPSCVPDLSSMGRAEAQAVASMCSFPYGPSVLTSGCLELGRQRCHESPEEQDAQAAGSVSAKEGKELGGDHGPARDLGSKLLLKLP